MNTPQPPSPRRRLQALLAIPDSQRTDAEWDELHELEIQLAPGNREGAPEPSARRNGPPQGGNKPRTGAPRSKPPGAGAPGGGNPKPGGAPQGKKPFRKPRKKSGKGGGDNPPKAEGA